jgi:hypothetical protein
MTIEGVCNQALDLIGYRRHITNIWDGSKAARIALNTWAETRDALLSKQQPRWAKRDDQLILLRSAPEFHYTEVDWTPAYPDLPWLYEYDTPVGCLVPLQVKPRLVVLPNWRPRPVSFRTKQNNTDHKYTILTNQVNAVLTCIYSVHDPDEWDAEFTEAMIQVLARKFQVGMGERQPQRQQQEGQQDANAA